MACFAQPSIGRCLGAKAIPIRDGRGKKESEVEQCEPERQQVGLSSTVCESTHVSSRQICLFLIRQEEKSDDYRG